MKTLVFGHYYSSIKAPRKEARAMDCQAGSDWDRGRCEEGGLGPLCCESGAVHGVRRLLTLGREILTGQTPGT